jgi:O-antigen ligase
MRHSPNLNFAHYQRLFGFVKAHAWLDLLSIISVFFLLFFAIIPLASEEVWYEATIVTFIFVLGILNLWQNKLEDEYRQLFKPILVLALFSLIHGIFTLFYSPNSAFYPSSFNLTASIWSSFKLLALAVFLTILLKTFKHKIRLLSLVLMFTGTTFAIFGVTRYFLQRDLGDIFALLISPKLATGIGFGTYFNQNHFAYLMLMVFGLFSSLFWYGNFSKVNRSLLLIGSLIVWIALVFSGSRGGIISSFIEVVVLILLPAIFSLLDKSAKSSKTLVIKLKSIARQFAILLFICTLFIFGIIFIGQDRVTERFDEIPNQISGTTSSDTFRRLDAWKAATQIISDFPIFGVGFGGFRVAVSQHIEISGQIVPKQTHNDYLELAASGGIVSVALICWFVFSLLQIIKERFTENSSKFSCIVRIGAVCGLAGIAVHNFFDFGLQIYANSMFFTAIICVVIHKSQYSNNFSQNSEKRKISSISKIFLIVTFAVLACFSLFYGIGRLSIEESKTANNDSFFVDTSFIIPFDADYFDAKSDLYYRFENYQAAKIENENAIRFRPMDYTLWLKAAQIEQAQNNELTAETSLLRAINLAPNYGEPYLNYGKFLLKINRKNEGFTALRSASNKNPVYFNEIAKIIWNENYGISKDVFDTLSPLNLIEREKLTKILFEKAEFSAIAQLNCNTEDLAEPYREGIVRQLLEKRQYKFANQVQNQDCKVSESIETVIEDASFSERNVSEGIGFGWRYQESDGYTSVSFDTGSSAEDRSLRFNFNGEDDSFALLSQIIFIEKKQKYRLNFSYKTADLVSGGMPVIQIIHKNHETENMNHIAGEALINARKSGWIQSSIEFEANNQTEAIEIRLARQSCKDQVCPIYGNLWLDDFQLRKISK